LFQHGLADHDEVLEVEEDVVDVLVLPVLLPLDGQEPVRQFVHFPVELKHLRLFALENVCGILVFILLVE